MNPWFPGFTDRGRAFATPPPLHGLQGGRSLVAVIAVLPLHGKHMSAASGHPTRVGTGCYARRNLNIGPPRGRALLSGEGVLNLRPSWPTRRPGPQRRSTVMNSLTTDQKNAVAVTLVPPSAFVSSPIGYPPTAPTGFLLFQDNLFGTIMLIPSGAPL